MDQSLHITEIYASVQGESSYAGLPCTFIRLTGCPLRCRWCDTVYSFQGGERLSFSAIFDKIKSIGINLIELTGGEPLAQEQTADFIATLLDHGYQVLIETGGSEPIANLPAKTHVIMDIKCPGSGMSDRNLWQNIDHLKSTDEVKFVIAGRDDFDWACSIIKEHRLEQRCQILLSCAFGLLAPKDLVEWMLAAKLNCRLNLQQHKYIWHPRAKGV